MWGGAIVPLARLGRVIVYDRRGCARSERPSPYDATPVAEQADDAAGLLDALAGVPPIVIGRSYGGEIALELSRERFAVADMRGDTPAGRPTAGYVRFSFRLKRTLEPVELALAPDDEDQASGVGVDPRLLLTNLAVIGA
jgi:pimeloyl-ACP methyl ester carboxylesterase